MVRAETENKQEASLLVPHQTNLKARLKALWSMVHFNDKSLMRCQAQMYLEIFNWYGIYAMLHKFPVRGYIGYVGTSIRYG